MNCLIKKILILLIAWIGIAGCQGRIPMPNRTLDFSPVLPKTPLVKNVADGSIYTNIGDGSIYSAGANDELFGDRKAYRVGDIITILLREKTFATKSVSNTTKREAANTLISAAQLAASAAKEAGFPFALLQNSDFTEQKNESIGTGIGQQRNQLSGDVSASVVRVLTNGNLVIRGEKLITLNNGDEYVQISGVIRPDDVQPNNTILSKRIANAEVTYSGHGELNEAARSGWGTRLLLEIWPF